jgi:hypothetical protein
VDFLGSNCNNRIRHGPANKANLAPGEFRRDGRVVESSGFLYPDAIPFSAGDFFIREPEGAHYVSLNLHRSISKPGNNELRLNCPYYAVASHG